MIFSQYLLNLNLRGYFSAFVLPLAVFFFQPGNVIMGVVAFVFCLLKRYILKEYLLQFEGFSIVFFP